VFRLTGNLIESSARGKLWNNISHLSIITVSAPLKLLCFGFAIGWVSPVGTNNENGTTFQDSRETTMVIWDDKWTFTKRPLLNSSPRIPISLFLLDLLISCHQWLFYLNDPVQQSRMFLACLSSIVKNLEWHDKTLRMFCNINENQLQTLTYFTNFFLLSEALSRIRGNAPFGQHRKQQFWNIRDFEVETHFFKKS